METWNSGNRRNWNSAIPNFLSPTTVQGELPSTPLSSCLFPFCSPSSHSTLQLSLQFSFLLPPDELIYSLPSSNLLRLSCLFNSYSWPLFSFLLFPFYLSLSPLAYFLYPSVLVITGWCDSICVAFLEEELYFTFGEISIPVSSILWYRNLDENNLWCLYLTIWFWEQTAFVLRVGLAICYFGYSLIRGYLAF